jgi:4-phytase/acid phosphatase
LTATARLAWIFLWCFVSAPALLLGQAASAPSKNQDAELKFVVYLSRHGVRSPTGKAEQYDLYSAAPWPRWSVAPGYLTAHGFQLMKLFGAYDRTQWTSQGLLPAGGCEGADRVSIYADSDQRTRESGKALAEGMFPGCAVAVHALPEGTPDALFHSMHAGGGHPDRALALAAIEGRIGGDASNLTAAYRPQLEALDKILAGCGRAQTANRERTPIFDVPAGESKGAGDRAARLRGPLTVASSLAENLLLEYAEGMKGADLGWGCLDRDALREAMQLHAADVDYTERTPAIARMDASNLLEHILKSMEQSAAGKAVAGAPGKPGDRLLILMGHDTNIATVAGALGLDWIVDGRRDDTPPGGALVFELWRLRGGGQFVRVFYTAQTLEQMRETQTLTPANPPAKAPIFVPGCSRQDMSCTWDGFSAAMRRAIDPAFVSAP